MKTNRIRCNTTSIQKTRWAAYAAAGAATTFAGANFAEAAIHYSGRLDVAFPRSGNTGKTFPLDQPGDSIRFIHSGSRSGGPAYWTVFGNVSAGFRSDGNIFGDIWYVARLSEGDKISAGPFYSKSSSIAGGLMAYGDSFGRWREPGIGYIGFRFNSGAGVQYGWIRVRMGGSDNKNAFRVLGYAYADPGEPITAGQRPHDEEQSPDQGSLGWLALGAVGLLAWRKGRSRTAR